VTLAGHAERHATEKSAVPASFALRLLLLENSTG